MGNVTNYEKQDLKNLIRIDPNIENDENQGYV